MILNDSTGKLIASCWALPATAREMVEDYFLRHWEGSYLKTRCEGFRKEGSSQNSNVLFYGGVWYNVHWHSAPLDCFAAKQVILSFRYSRKYGAHVIVRIKGSYK